MRRGLGMIRTEAERKELVAELTAFRSGLIRYKELVLAVKNRKPVDKEEVDRLGLDLQQDYGSLKDIIQECGGPAVLLLQGGAYKCEVFRDMFSHVMFGPEALEAVMNLAIATVGIAVGGLEKLSLSKSVDSEPLTPPKAFIAHGGDSEALGKLKDFLRALGVDSLVVEEEASEDRSANENVEHYLSEADCAIVLATKGDIDGRTREFLPRGNILVELGRCQERFPNKAVWLLEEDTRFPSNVSEKVWERFTQSSMEKAFIKIAKELRAFGIIKTGRPDK
jgi:hypothetical protein